MEDTDDGGLSPVQDPGHLEEVELSQVHVGKKDSPVPVTVSTPLFRTIIMGLPSRVIGVPRGGSGSSTV